MLKRQKVPKSWPIFRKGTKYVVKPMSHFKLGIPVLVVLRDALKIAQTRKEAKKMIHGKNVLLNSKVIKDEREGVVLFDVITLNPMKKSYRLGLSGNGKFILEEVKDSESGSKIAKILNKKVLKGKKTQLNLSDGRNFLSDIECKVNDSVLINFKDKKIDKCVPLKEKAGVVVFAGKHAGKRGNIEKMNSEKKIAELNVDGKKINVLIKQLMATE